ncbi:MAG: hypothetical protein ALAOOOJD_02856 [bacterium]|nr:hypothetical protein [bacterium]
MQSRLCIILVTLLWSFWACNDSRKPEQPAEGESSGSLKAPEQTPNAGITVEPAGRVPSESEADSLLQLQQQIMQQPENSALRRELGRRAIEVNAGVVWVVGKGRINPKAATANTALNQARHAAALDAGRWAAYLLEWHKTDYATHFGSIQANLPGLKVVRESVNDSLCVVLAQAPLKQN